ncbi:S41 family peptidase [Neolewinella antarctica]|uniref:Tail specific protease domain-containing protein n=1 Tax=Neolewinella antarctica TaxID=442734 RepID=A0ABX0XEI4_9BACT|nr:S41 family peptidase [Neolewinella antarctica]NJC27299.1 hypothetical protein [Neolewinella antarctica]
MVYLEEPGGKKKTLTNEEIIASYAGAPIYQPEAEQSYSDGQRIAGDYAFANYLVRVVPTGNSPGRYVAYILHADGVYWQKGQVKFELTATDDGGFDSSFRLRNHELSEDRRAHRLDDTRLLAGGVIWKSTSINKKSDPALDQQIMAAESERPILYRYDDKTVVIRFPSFAAEWSDHTDSLVAANNKLLTTNNLVIDLRGNQGGSDRTYESVMNIIKTRPATTDYDVSFLNTEDNRAVLEQYVDPERYPRDVIDYVKNVIGQLAESPDGFVVLNPTTSGVTPSDHARRYPERVAVLIDRNCGSSGEQFALDARESWRVKLFGEPTAGGIDASNLQSLEGPCGNYSLIYTSTVTSRADIVPIDGIGVQPDYPLALTGNPYHVISEVVRLMNDGY